MYLKKRMKKEKKKKQYKALSFKAEFEYQTSFYSKNQNDSIVADNK